MKPETLEFKKFVEAKSLFFTPERQNIAEEVFGCHRHFDADELLRLMKAKGQKASRATIYRSLDLLVASGLVDKIDMGEGRAVYEHTAGHPHHDHLICISCGTVQEFEEPLIEQLQQWACEKADFEAIKHNLNIYGYCDKCR